MTAKVTPIFDDPGYFKDKDVGTWKEPIFLPKRGEISSYYAVLKKPFWTFTACEFVKYARRLTSLCMHVYGRANFELKRNNTPFNFNFSDNALQIGKKKGVSIGITFLTDHSFREIFMASSSIGLRILQKPHGEAIAKSFAMIEWTSTRPRTLFFYAKNGEETDNRTGHGELQSLLRQQLFIPGVIPEPKSKLYAKVGPNDYLEECRVR